ncbi:DUF192 domain-containing protein [Bordetella genomosp. 7]|uniref:DUF192 domain-containing protein n=1 Tax=Bordetella genomosp. 7 TaxID=1416805 RepID=A0A261RD78_9BORD|nr:DUF192 domain-containing protein [Bordetella genomosp. 7]OZI22737.1 hypothetical protein CAL19_09500 [Bordetella genomosp. 7]
MSTHRPLSLPRLLTGAAAVVALWLGLPCHTSAQSGPVTAQPPLPVAKLTAGIHVIQAELADTEESRRIGLMHRQSLPDNNGMLFVFDSPDLQCFWMRNTPLPLSIAFIADDGVIVNIADMAPQTDDAHCSARPVRYALEMAQGWYARRGIKAGNLIKGLPRN